MIGVILCGGAGSRLWPVSRDLYPKPFLRLPDGESLIGKAFHRAASAPEAERILVVTNHEIYFKVKEEFSATQIELDSYYLLEPFGRNTAPAIAAAALQAVRTNGEDVPLLVLASDHLITDGDAFNRAVEQALALAKNEDRLVTFGIKPHKPETGFGYVEYSGTDVIRFVEKPDEESARQYVESGKFLWNSGMFCFKAGVILSELERYSPELVDGVRACLDGEPEKDTAALPGPDHFALSAAAFGAVPGISIDFAVMEKSDRVSVIPCDMGWNDIGSWNELCALTPADQNGNRVSEPKTAVLHDAKNCNVSNKDRLVAVLGMDNVLVVDTPDALLVADNSRAQDVRHLYTRLKEKGHETHKHHRTIYRPWGSYTLLETGNRFKIKRLVIKPGASISLQLHHHRSEHWIVVSGMARVTLNGEETFVNTNEAAYIKAGCRHRVENSGKVDLVIIEVQSGEYLGEDDIERFEDIYGRC